MRTRWLAMLALLAVVAGCSSSSPHAAVPPLVTSTPTPSAAATPTASPAPAVTAPPPAFVSPATEAGAIAFALVYFKELDRAYATGDTSRLAPYRLATCSCLGFEKEINSYHHRGGQIIGEQTFVDEWSSNVATSTSAEVSAFFHTRDVVNKLPGQADTVTKAGSGVYVVYLHRSKATWIVADIHYRETIP